MSFAWNLKNKNLIEFNDKKSNMRSYEMDVMQFSNQDMLDFVQKDLEYTKSGKNNFRVDHFVFNFGDLLLD